MSLRKNSGDGCGDGDNVSGGCDNGKDEKVVRDDGDDENGGDDGEREHFQLNYF